MYVGTIIIMVFRVAAIWTRDKMWKKVFQSASIIVVMIIYINIERKKLKIQQQYARKKNRKFFGRSEKCSKSN